MSVLETATATMPDLAALKQKQHGAWSSGDYAVIGSTLQIVGENPPHHVRRRARPERHHDPDGFGLRPDRCGRLRGGR